MTDEERRQILAAIRTLMVADNFGDVHEAVNRLHRALGIAEPDGDYLDGWTEADRTRVGFGS